MLVGIYNEGIIQESNVQPMLVIELPPLSLRVEEGDS
ncbi:hypothetical protein IEC_05736 [Bacillus toyonensis]|nr:hypothetical protein IEC_05836 [Bacillus toyonensis]EJQ29293.1 hypothetical protein IEC_05736 [Bacillus toyonensis]EJV90704.1 hypothetical protein IGI_05235 [Bacillus toyonensis]EOP46084.1 hypothetical protein IKI_05217 [Bacillus toyonensis]